MLFTLVVCVLLLLGLVGVGSVQGELPVVEPAGGADVDFLSVLDAVDAAADDALILIRAGFLVDLEIDH